MIPLLNDGRGDQAAVLKRNEYSFMETSFGGRLLVFKGYSFRRKSLTNQRSYWFCCRAKCSSKGILHSDGKFQLTKSEHNHKPDLELIKKKEKLLQLKKLALRLNLPGPDLLKSMGIHENTKKHLSFIRTCRSRKKRKSQTSIGSTKTPTVEAGLNYKRLASQTFSKEMMLHSGYLYIQDSANSHEGNHVLWRCKVKKCKARAKTDEVGNFTISKPDHNHPPEEIEKISRELTSKAGSETAHSREAAVRNSKKKNLKSCGLKRKGLETTERNKSQKLSTGEEQELVISKMRSNSSASSFETFSIDQLITETLEKNYGVTPQ